MNENGTDKLKEYLKAKVIIQKVSLIYKLLKSSEFISSSLFSMISKLNLENEIPF